MSHRYQMINTAVKLIAGLGLVFAAAAQAQQAAEEPAPEMGFFVTSAGIGNGGNLGGLAGADAHCQSLAANAGSKKQAWAAYLSTQATETEPAINARDRIGTGPWHNAMGDLIASDINDLHYNNYNLRYETSLDENGVTINSAAMGDTPNKHDILTGSQLDGTAFPAGEDRTCSNWTGSNEGSAMVGHSDRHRFTTPGSPWNSAHPSRGCSQQELQASGGDGLFYCFTTDSTDK